MKFIATTAAALSRLWAPIFGACGLVGCVLFWTLAFNPPAFVTRALQKVPSVESYFIILGVLLPMIPMFSRDPATVQED